MDQSETAYSVASNVTKESGFTDSFVKSKSTMLIKVLLIILIFICMY